MLQRPSPDVIQEIHRMKRELLLVRRAMWPMREVLSRMQRDPHECFSDVTRTYMRDVYDHAVQAIDIVETYREVAGGLTETYMTAISNRMNEVMKVLTIIGTIFIPLTFLAGVYGMNFEYLPEFEWRYGYPVFWVICARDRARHAGLVPPQGLAVAEARVPPRGLCCDRRGPPPLAATAQRTLTTSIPSDPTRSLTSLRRTSSFGTPPASAVLS